MKFCIERTIAYTNQERVIITTKKEDYFERGYEYDVKYMCNAIIETTRDFNLDEKFPIVSDTDSIQIRPKGIFRSNKGYFYKGSNKERVYLNKIEEMQMYDYILKAKIYLKDLKL